MADLLAEIRHRRKRIGRSLPALVKDAGLTCTADSLSRKLAGKQALRLDEATAVAGALGCELRLTRRWRAA